MDTTELRAKISSCGLGLFVTTDELLPLLDIADAATKASSVQVLPDVAALTQAILEIDGVHTLGAGALAERLHDWFQARAEPAVMPSSEPDWRVLRRSLGLFILGLTCRGPASCSLSDIEQGLDALLANMPQLAGLQQCAVQLPTRRDHGLPH